MEETIFQTLTKYEKQFRQIKESDYCRLPGTPSLRELDECYRVIFGKGSKLMNGCSNCIYNSLRELSKAYWKEVESRTELEKKESESKTVKRQRKKKVTPKEELVNTEEIETKL